MSGYDFSPLYRSSLSAFSPGSTFLATTHLNRLIVRSTHNLSIVRAWDLQPSLSSEQSAVDGAGPSKSSSAPAKAKAVVIDEIQWSDDGLHILAVSLSEQAFWVYGLAEEGGGADGEVVRIQAGPQGLEGAKWAKGGREVVCWSEHSLRMSIYDISSRFTSSITSPKGSIDCHAIDPNGRYLAVLETHNATEHVGVYDLQDGCSLVRHFPIATSSARSLQWSPCGKYLAIAESWLSLYIYSPIGPLISAYPSRGSSSVADERPEPRQARSHRNNAPKQQKLPDADGRDADIDHMGLGIKSMAWCPGGRAILVGGWEGRVEVVDPVTGRCLGAIQPTRRVGAGVAVWQEPVDWLKDTRSRGIVQFDRGQNPPLLPAIPPNMSASPPLSGPTHLLPSPSGAFLVLAHATQPRVVQVYALCPSPGAIPDMKHLCAMVLRESVRDVKWAARGNKEKLMVVSKIGGVYVWDKEGWVDEDTSVVQEGEEAGEGGVVEGVGIPNSPAGFAPATLHVSPDGRAIVVQSRKDFCVMYDEDEDQDGNNEPVPPVAAAEVKYGAAHYEKEWDSEGLSLVMETEEEEEDEERVGDGASEKEALMDLHSYGAYRPRATGNGMRRSILQKPAWRPSDVRA